jgi:hypothetical protein
MKNTRFSSEDLRKIDVEFAAIKERLSRLSDLMLRANLLHTQAQFYDSRVRRVTDSLPRKLHALDDLLWNERMRHPVEDASRTSVEARLFEVRA